MYQYTHNISVPKNGLEPVHVLFNTYTIVKFIWTFIQSLSQGIYINTSACGLEPDCCLYISHRMITILELYVLAISRELYSSTGHKWLIYSNTWPVFESLLQ